MSELKAFIEALQQKYGKAKTVPAESEANLCGIPEPLKEFYSLYDNVCFPFGYIDPPDEAIKHSAQAEPFRSEGAFVFGADNNDFCFWLCRQEGADEDGCMFTVWDHDLEDGIEYAFGNLIELLEYAEKEYLEISG